MKKRVLMITHDLGAIPYICDDVAVIYRGKPVERGPVEDIFERPTNDYKRMLLNAMPDRDPNRSPFRQVVSAQRFWSPHDRGRRRSSCLYRSGRVA